VSADDAGRLGASTDDPARALTCDDDERARHPANIEAAAVAALDAELRWGRAPFLERRRIVNDRHSVKEEFLRALSELEAAMDGLLELGEPMDWELRARCLRIAAKVNGLNVDAMEEQMRELDGKRAELGEEEHARRFARLLRQLSGGDQEQAEIDNAISRPDNYDKDDPADDWKRGPESCPTTDARPWPTSGTKSASRSCNGRPPSRSERPTKVNR